MSAVTNIKTSSYFVVLNENHTALIQRQLKARPEDAIPEGISKKTFEEKVKCLLPPERVAIDYVLAEDKFLFLFWRALGVEREKRKLTNEQLARISKAKEAIETLYEDYRHVGAKCNLFVIFKTRILSNIAKVYRSDFAATLNKATKVTQEGMTLAADIMHAIFLLNTSEDLKDDFLQEIIKILRLLKTQLPNFDELAKPSEKDALKALLEDIETLECTVLARDTLLPLLLRVFEEKFTYSIDKLKEIVGMSLDSMELSCLSMIHKIREDKEFEGRKRQKDKEMLIQQIEKMYAKCVQLGNLFFSFTHLKVKHSYEGDAFFQQTKKINDSLTKGVSEFIKTEYRVVERALTDKVMDKSMNAPIFKIYIEPCVRLLVQQLNDIAAPFCNVLGKQVRIFLTNYNSMLPEAQRKMCTDLFCPFDLLVIKALGELFDLKISPIPKESYKPIMKTVNYLRSALLTRWERMIYPFRYEEELVKDLGGEITGALFTLKEHLEILSKTDEHANTVKKMSEIEKILRCLNLCMVGNALPFIMSPLGNGRIAPDSHEHVVAAKIAQIQYMQLRDGGTVTTTEKKALDETSTLNTIETLLQQPSQNSKKVAKGFKSLYDRMWAELDIKTRDLEPFTPQNFLEQYRVLLDMALPKAKLYHDLCLLENIPTEDIKRVELQKWSIPLELVLIKVLARYYSINSLETAPAETAPTKEKVVRRPQITVTAPQSSIKSDRPLKKVKKKKPLERLQALHQQVGCSLALAVGAKEAQALEMMRDYHHQVRGNLSAINTLLYTDLRPLQVRALFTRLAAAIEQTVKLTACAHAFKDKQTENLSSLYSSHNPAALLTFTASYSTEDRDFVKDVAESVNNFLVLPARYGVGLNAWTEDMKDALRALEILLNDCVASLPKNNTATYTPDTTLGLIYGLDEMKLFVVPEVSGEWEIPESLKLDNTDRVMPLSHKEPSTQLAKRRSEVESNAYVFSVNEEQMQELLADPSPAEWCDSYASSLLLKGAAMLEKSLQTLLWQLPVPAEGDPSLHMLLSTKAVDGKMLPLKYEHSIVGHAKIIAAKLGPQGQVTAATGDKFGWLEPILKQLYRYPFTKAENNAALTLRTFYSFAELRMKLVQGTMSDEAKGLLGKCLLTDEASLLETLDALIYAHLQEKVVDPMRELAAALQEIYTK